MIKRNLSETLPIISILFAIVYGISFAFAAVFPVLTISRCFFGFFIVTYLIGASVRLFLKKVLKISGLPTTLTVGGLCFDVLFSMMLSLVISTLLIHSFLFNELYLVLIFIPLVIFLNLFVLRQNVQLDQAERPLLNKAKVLSIAGPWIILFFACILFGSYFRGQTPFPTINGWDMNSSLAYINWITSHNGYSYLLIPSFPAGGTPYSAFFFFLISEYSVFLGVSPYILFWYGVFPLIFSYMLLVFFIAFKFSNNHWVSLTSAFIAFFSSVAAAEIVRNPLYVTLDMVSQIIFLLIIVFALYYETNGLKKNLINFTAAVFLLLFNYFTAVVVFPFLFWTIIGRKNIPLIGNGKRVFKISIIALAFFFSIIIALSSYFIPAVSSLFTSTPFPVSLKLQTVSTIYPLYFWVVFIVALFSIALFQTHDNKSLTYTDILLYILLGFTLYLMPFWVTYRLEFYLRVFLAVTVSAIFLLFDNGPFKRLLHIPFQKFGSKKIKLGTIASILLLITTCVLMIPLFTNYSAYAYISRDEYAAAKWLNDNTPPATYIITDPSSGYLLRGMTLRNASSYFALPDGRMPADSSTIYPSLVDELRNFLSSKTALAWVQLSSVLPSNNVYIVVTSRTVYWATSSSDVAITHPLDGVNFSLITDKLMPPYFHEVYYSNTVRIYKPDSSLAVQEKAVYSDSNFTGNWTWYLDGSHGGHSFDVANHTLLINTQAKSNESAWTGLAENITCLGATSFKIESELQGYPDQSTGHPYMTQIILYDASGNRVTTFNNAGLSSKSAWTVDTFPLTDSQASAITKMSLVIWTKDTCNYSWAIRNITFSYFALTTGNSK
jgi:hypothetical protein